MTAPAHPPPPARILYRLESLRATAWRNAEDAEVRAALASYDRCARAVENVRAYRREVVLLDEEIQALHDLVRRAGR